MNFKDIFPNSCTTPAFIFPEETLTYSALLDQIDKSRNEMSQIPECSTIILKGNYNKISISYLLAALELGHIVIPLDSEESRDLLTPFANVEIKIETEVVIKFLNKETTPNQLISGLRKKRHAGLIYLTSGTGGDPKIVLHDFNLFFDKMIKPSTVHTAILFLKFNHFGGLNTFLPILSSGGTLVIPKSKNPYDVFKCIEKNKVSLLPTTPSFLAMSLALKAYKEFDLSSLKVISYGAEPMSEDILEAWSSHFPEIVYHQTYGMTETGTLKTKGQGKTSLYMKIIEKNSSVRIREGKLELKLPYFMCGYLNAPSPITEDGWLNTGDFASETNDGFIKITGRHNEIIYVSGEKVSPHEIENFISKIPGVWAVKVYSKASIFSHQIIAADIFVSTELQTENFIREVKTACIAALPFYKVPVEIDFYDPLKNDEVKKIRKPQKK